MLPALRTFAEERIVSHGRSGQGGAVTKRCPDCDAPVLAEHRGTVERIAPAEIVKIEPTGNVVAVCLCGRRVVWYRVRRRPVVTTS
jgi:hypothetical protein